MREDTTMVGIPDHARAYWADQKLRCYFGFAGCRACIAFLYARSNGATQKEVNKVAWSLGTTQKDYTNMLRMAKNNGATGFTLGKMNCVEAKFTSLFITPTTDARANATMLLLTGKNTTKSQHAVVSA